MAKSGRSSADHPWQPQSLLASPLFAALWPVIRRMPADRFPALEDCNAQLAARQPAITVSRGLPIRCVPQAQGKQAFEAQYEPRCYLTGEVQTRADNWHDLLNALVWLTFPKAKAAINARHYRALTVASAGEFSSQRGAVRDTNTLLDESGVIVAYADDELAGLLRDFRWKALFWQRREQVRQRMGFFLFGHGLYEKALQPYVGMTGQGWLLRVEAGFFVWPLERQLAHLDESLASYLAEPEHGCSTRELAPVPLLGVPGWSVENEREGYYDNVAYFRSGRQSDAQRTPLITAPSSVAG
ncbi:DUF3025 domain-containing protein [Ferriphaselus sp. R-1]|uniref:DUF3025 domain-containing protein n=1 Tax=Ferriphaselus sp. R-1 TaxID=1485544 RepID=UPI0006914F10|nr:DUF3025 domain-containing protein [Ferriphaselus sp. R-1]